MNKITILTESKNVLGKGRHLVFVELNGEYLSVYKTEALSDNNRRYYNFRITLANKWNPFNSILFEARTLKSFIKMIENYPFDLVSTGFYK